MKSLITLLAVSTLPLTACGEKAATPAPAETAATPEQVTTLSDVLKKLDSATTLEEAAAAYQVQGLARKQKITVDNAYDQKFFALAPAMKAKGESVTTYAITFASKGCNITGKCGP